MRAEAMKGKLPPLDMALHIRIYRGIADHLVIRVSEWVMIWPTLGLWLALQIDNDMFSKSPSFDQLAAWATESQWSAIMGAAALCRLAALIINGTFKGFEFSPHIRLGASLVGLALWSQFCLGVLIAYLTKDGALSGVIAYSTLVLFELVNLGRSGFDVVKNLPKRP
jgi:hypothetical protein